MKKITILALHLGYGGIENCISLLANNLVNNYDVEILSVYKLYDKPAFFIDNKVKIKYLTKIKPNNNEFKNYLKQHKFIKSFIEGIKGLIYLTIKKRSVIKSIKNIDSDIVISTRDYLNKYLGKYKKSGVYTIGWEHNHPNDNIKYIKLLSKSVNNLDKLVVVSNSIKDIYSKFFIDNNISTKVVCIPNFLSNIPNKYSKLNNDNLISVGRLSKEKGFLSLIEVYNLVYKENNNIKLTLVGDGVEKDTIKDKINEYKLNVNMTGFLSQDKINKLYLDSSIYIMTSYTESFGLVLIEAMSYGVVPISFTTANGALDLIKDGYNGYLIDNRDINKMKDKIIYLLNNKDELKRMSKNCIEYSKNYSKDIVMNKWISLLEEQ